jgi:CheY-like chemotaxis protein
VRQAKIAVAQARYDVALVDLHLADADGLELVSDLRTHDATRALPVIVMTAKERIERRLDRLSTLQLADWLQKPIDPSRLLDAIHNVLLELRDRRARILHVEDDESLTQLVEELLSDEAEVVRAHSLAQARAHVEARRFDLVIWTRRWATARPRLAAGAARGRLLTRRRSSCTAPPSRAASWRGACRPRWSSRETRSNTCSRPCGGSRAATLPRWRLRNEPAAATDSALRG